MKHFNKVFGVGMSKTGTSTLGRCFEILGLVPHVGFDAKFKRMVKQGRDHDLVMKAAENFRSFEDSPWYLMYEELDQRFPGSKFILTVRSDTLTYAKSSWEHGVARGRRRGAPTQEYITTKSQAYESHNEAVRDYFKDRADDLLVLCWEEGDGWEKLCAFLGTDVPPLPVPNLNAGSYHNGVRPSTRAILDSYPYMMLRRGMYYMSSYRKRLSSQPMIPAAPTKTSRRANGIGTLPTEDARRQRLQPESLLKERAAGYYPEIDPHDVRVRMLRTSSRRYTSIKELELSSGGFRRPLIAKTPLSKTRKPGGERQPQRPRLTMPAAGDAGLLEYRALSAIEDHIGGLGDPRFGTIRVLDLLHDPYTIIMEKSADRPLLCQVATARSLLHVEATAELAAALRNTGAWLQRFHQLPTLAHTRNRTASRDDVLTAVDRYVEYLRDACQGEQVLSELQRTLASAASDLPEHLPLGTSHGDFAPRNILIGPSSRVTVCDTRGRWRTPIYEDMGYFFFALKTSRWQVATLGSADNSRALDDYERQFSSGYFEDQFVPMHRIRLFEAITLFDKWASLVHAHQTASGAKRLMRCARLVIFQRFANRYCARLLRQLEGDPQ